MSNPAREALTRAVNRAIANGAPVYENVPPQKIWTVAQLTAQLPLDLAQCHTAHERFMVTTYHNKAIREAMEA
jgi:hypothetical protein